MHTTVGKSTCPHVCGAIQNNIGYYIHILQQQTIAIRTRKDNATHQKESFLFDLLFGILELAIKERAHNMSLQY